MKNKENSYDAEVLGAKIREARKSRDMSQESLAQAANIDRSFLGRIERGEMNLSVKVLYRLAQALDYSVVMLLP